MPMVGQPPVQPAGTPTDAVTEGKVDGTSCQAAPNRALRKTRQGVNRRPWNNLPSNKVGWYVGRNARGLHVDHLTSHGTNCPDQIPIQATVVDFVSSNVPFALEQKVGDGTHNLRSPRLVRPADARAERSLGAPRGGLFCSRFAKLHCFLPPSP